MLHEPERVVQVERKQGGEAERPAHQKGQRVPEATDGLDRLENAERLRPARWVLLDDGVFHVTIWSGYSLSDFVLRSAAMYDGSHVKLKGTRTATARSVRLEPLPGARGPLDIEADGELIGRLPATFTVVPGVVRLVS